MGKRKHQIGDSVSGGVIVGPPKAGTGRYEIRCSSCHNVSYRQPNTNSCRPCYTEKRRRFQVGKKLPDGRLIKDVDDRGRFLVECPRCGRDVFKHHPALGDQCWDCRNQEMSYDPTVLARKKKIDSLRQSATKRGLSVSLTDDDIIELIESDCYWCGICPDSKLNGVDRLDSKNGYHKTNCVAACWKCNRAKASLSVAEWLDLVARIYHHSVQDVI